MFSQKAKERIHFELTNLIQINNLTRANFAFEVSSEGELEQVNPLLNYLLDSGETVELVFCSESVEHRCKELKEKYPNQLRIFRYPILTFRPFSKNKNINKWLTAKTLFLCRYDFFPELMEYGKRKDIRFILLSGAAQTYPQKGLLAKWYLKNCYQSFDQIVAATIKDEDHFIKYCSIKKINIDHFDFRMINIANRIENKEKSISNKFEIFNKLNSELISKYKNRNIFGSFWAQEVTGFNKQVLAESSTESINCIAPHLLDNTSLNDLLSAFENVKIPTYHINNTTTEGELDSYIEEFKIKPGVWIFNVKGVLCELYAYFNRAYIGGGFGESIHSVLEPYLNGCEVYHGPKCHRSSELTYIERKSSDRVNLVSDIENILELMTQPSNNEGQKETHFDGQIIKDYERILIWLKLKIG
jgi:3-deoxy-D-manno-octulosonic-acid transferase